MLSGISSFVFRDVVGVLRDAGGRVNPSAGGDWASRPPVGDDRGVTTPTAPRSRYSMGSTQNLVLSLLAVLGLVAVLVLIVPRVSSVSGPPVDVHATAVDVSEQSGWPIVEAVGLPDGWTATSARYVRTTDGYMTWHAGYQLPDGTYVAVEQTMDPSRAWVEAQTNRAPKTGTDRGRGPHVDDVRARHQGAEQPARRPADDGRPHDADHGHGELRADGRLRDVPPARHPLSPGAQSSALIRASARSSHWPQCAASTSPRCQRLHALLEADLTVLEPGHEADELVAGLLVAHRGDVGVLAGGLHGRRVGRLARERPRMLRPPSSPWPRA